VIILQDSNFRHVRLRQESDIAKIAASVMEWQHVKSRTLKLTQPETRRMSPRFVAPMHLPSPISTNDVQLLKALKAESETRAPSILMAFRFFKSLKQRRRIDEHSCSHVRIVDEIYFKKYRNAEQDAQVVKLEKPLTVKL